MPLVLSLVIVTMRTHILFDVALRRVSLLIIDAHQIGGNKCNTPERYSVIIFNASGAAPGFVSTSRVQPPESCFFFSFGRGKKKIRYSSPGDAKYGGSGGRGKKRSVPLSD